MSENLYKKSTSSISYYGSNGLTEANMRQEMINTLDGAFPEISKKQSGLLRKMRLDSNNKLIPCSCVDSITKEPDKDRFCAVCWGEGFLWGEENIDFYRVNISPDQSNVTLDKLQAPGLINVPLVVFYIRYSVDIKKNDKIIQLYLDNDGSKTIPNKRKAIFRIEHLWDYRADNGKLEYWKIFTHEEKVKYINPPSYSDL